MVVEKTQSRTLKRKPLSDCSNVIQARIPSSHSKPSEVSLSIKESDVSSLKHDSSVGSHNVENPSVEPQPSTPTNQRSLAVSGTADRENSGIVSTYSRKRKVETRKDKGKEVAHKMSVSCPPVVRVRDLGTNLSEEHADAGHSKSVGASHPRSKKKKHFSLPQDFIDQQNAYFAEIDAFVLPEEFESDNDT